MASRLFDTSEKPEVAQSRSIAQPNPRKVRKRVLPSAAPSAVHCDLTTRHASMFSN